MEILDLVRKKQGYNYTGIIVSEYNKLTGEKRYVVENISEDCFGMLHIFNENQLELINVPKLKGTLLTDFKIYIFINISETEDYHNHLKHSNTGNDNQYEFYAKNKYEFVLKLKDILYSKCDKDLLDKNKNNIMHILTSYDRYENEYKYKFEYIINKLKLF